MVMDTNETEDRHCKRSQVVQVLHVLNEARIKYAIFGAAACVHHGGQWLWKCQDYEIYIEDWFDGPQMRRVVDTITAECSSSWKYDHRFDAAAWAEARGDRHPRRVIRRFKHTSHPELGVVLIPSDSSYIRSMHHDDLVNEEQDPVWIYPSLKNYVESQLGLWRFEGRNSALIDLLDVVGARRLNQAWAVEVGLELNSERTPSRPDLPSKREIWDECVRMSLESPNRQRATARFAARRAEKETEALAEEQAEDEGVGGSGQRDVVAAEQSHI